VLGDGNTGTSSIVLVANNSGGTSIANAITVANLGTGLVSIGGTNTGASSANAWTGTLTLNRNVQVFGDTTPGSSGRTSFLGQITGSGGITVTQGRVTLQNGTNNFTGPVVVNSGATLQLDVDTGLNEVIPNSAAVTVNGLLNFASRGGTETIGSLAGSGTVSSVVSGNYSLVVGGSTSTTFSGVITNGSGVIGLTKSGNGTLLLTGANGFTGGAALNGGTLAAGSANALGSSGAISFGGGTLQYSASNTTDYSGRFSNAAGQQYSIDTNGQNVTLGSNLTSSAGSFTKLGAGGVTLSGNNTYGGGTLVSQGTLVGGASTSFGSGAIVLGDGNTGTSSVVLVANNSGNTSIANAITVANLGTGLVSIGGTNTGSSSANAWTGTLTLNRNVQVFGDTTPGSSGRTSFLGQITGSGGITVTQGRVTLQNGTNNFTGPVVVNSGATLQLDIGGGTNEVIPNSAAVTVNGLLNFASGGGTETIGSLAGSGTVSSFVAGTYSLVVGGSTSTTFSGVITNGSGVIGLTKSGTGTLTLSGPNSYTGGTIVSAGQLVGTTASLQGAITNNASVAFDQATTGNYSSLMSGSGSLTKLGVGTVWITGSNSYSGGTTVTGGIVGVSAGGSVGGSAAGLGTGTVSIASGGQVTYYLSIAGTHTIANAFSLSGGNLYSEDGNNNFAGLVTLASGASTISSRYQDTITLSGGLAGSGDVLFTQAGGLGDGPTYVLPSAGSNTGTVRVSGSSNGRITKLQVANVNALQSATLDMAAGDLGTVEFTVAGTNTYSLGGLQGARNLAFGGNSLSVGGNNQSTTYSGILSGSGVFSKVGNGTLTLSGSNSSTGLTSVNAGGLRLNGSIAGGLNVAAIATLSGTGTIGGNATIAGTHSPGNSPGVQTFNGNLTYSPGAVVNWELIANTTGTAGVNYDQIIMPTGNLTFSGSTTLALAFNQDGSTVNWSDSFWNVNRAWTVYDLSGGTTTSFSNLSLGGSLLDSVGNPLSPTERGYFTTSLSGQDVMLNFVAVPEPTTIALTGVAALALGAGAIRRARKARQESAAAV
jgi:autotransporter-associated beta strand protein